jgi:hypothetical protein
VTHAQFIEHRRNIALIHTGKKCAEPVFGSGNACVVIALATFQQKGNFYQRPSGQLQSLPSLSLSLYIVYCPAVRLDLQLLALSDLLVSFLFQHGNNGRTGYYTLS